MGSVSFLCGRGQRPGAEFVEYEVSGSSSSLRDFGVLSAGECERDWCSWYA